MTQACSTSRRRGAGVGASSIARLLARLPSSRRSAAADPGKRERAFGRQGRLGDPADHGAAALRRRSEAGPPVDGKDTRIPVGFPGVSYSRAGAIWGSSLAP